MVITLNDLSFFLMYWNELYFVENFMEQCDFINDCEGEFSFYFFMMLLCWNLIFMQGQFTARMKDATIREDDCCYQTCGCRKYNLSLTLSLESFLFFYWCISRRECFPNVHCRVYMWLEGGEYILFNCQWIKFMGLNEL